MADANIQNLDELDRFQQSIAKLRNDSAKQAEERVSNWLEKELPDYWSEQKRIAEIRWTEARQDLLRCEAKTRDEDSVSCSVQKKLLQKATERRKTCEEKVRIIPQLLKQWLQFSQEFKTHLRQLEDLSDSTLQLALDRLQALIAVIKNYLQ
jgi:hypothetical protein